MFRDAWCLEGNDESISIPSASFYSMDKKLHLGKNLQVANVCCWSKNHSEMWLITYLEISSIHTWLQVKRQSCLDSRVALD